MSTSEDSHLSHCDPEWCIYLQVTAEGVEPEQKRKEGKHGQHLPRDASDILVSIFECLTKPDLLERCISRGMSNANESLHSVIWRSAPKLEKDWELYIQQGCQDVDRCDDGRCLSGWNKSPALYSCGQDGSGEPC